MKTQELITSDIISEDIFLTIYNSLEEIDKNIFRLIDIDFDLTQLINFFSDNPVFQNPVSPVYQQIKSLLILRYALHYEYFGTVDSVLGIPIKFPYHSFGTINSKHFFGIDALLIYNFYKRNTSKYKKVCDIGTNVGLHSKILCELGYQVVSYEPDTNHAEIAKSYLKGYANHSFHRCAVSSYDGKAIFTRILNNTTGSYINDKRESYGPTVVYEVDVVNASHLSGQYDLFKLDVEGSEVDILSSFNQEDFQVSDFIVEISSPVSRYNFWQIFSKNKIPVYSQKNSWEKVRVMEQLPTSHKEGSVFISSKNTWS